MQEEKTVQIDRNLLAVEVCTTVSNNILATLADAQKMTGIPIDETLKIVYEMMPQIILNMIQYSIEKEPMKFFKDYRQMFNKGHKDLIQRIEDNPEVLQEWLKRHEELREPVSKLILPDNEIKTIN